MVRLRKSNKKSYFRGSGASLAILGVMALSMFVLTSMYLSVMVHLADVDSARPTHNNALRNLGRVGEKPEKDELIRVEEQLQQEQSVSIVPNVKQAARKGKRSRTVVTPAQQLESFLSENPDTPGARFVGLLREYLHVEHGAENLRLQACWNEQFALCIGGIQNFRQGKLMGQVDSHPADAEKNTQIALWENDPTKNVYNILRYHHDHETIPFMQSQAACLPLILAGNAVQDPNSVVVELGPFAGFSSKCIVTGMAKNKHNGGDYHAFDTFEEVKNYRGIIKRAPWLKESHPEFNENNTSFHFLWEDAVKPIYPTAKSTAGYIDESTLNSKALGKNKMVSMIAIDSAKDAQSLKDQIAGLGTLKKGTIIFLMDFRRVDQQMKQVYGCLRERFLLPVYSSFIMEHWAFVVTEDFSFQDPSLGQCYINIYQNQDEYYKRFEELVESDMNFLVGLTEEISDPTEMFGRQHLKKNLVEKLRDKAFQFKKIAFMYPGIREAFELQ